SLFLFCFFFSSRRRHTRSYGDWSSDVCSSDLIPIFAGNWFELHMSDLSPNQAALSSLIENAPQRLQLLQRNRCRVKGLIPQPSRSEERRVGKECRSRRSRDH